MARVAAELVRLISAARARAAGAVAVLALATGLLSACSSGAVRADQHPPPTTGGSSGTSAGPGTPSAPDPTPSIPSAGAHCRVPEPTTDAAETPQPPAVPLHGIYVGAFSQTGEATQDGYINSLDSLANKACRPLNIAHVYLRWNYSFPTQAESTFASQGKALLVSWTGTDTIAMASGADDATIAATARQIASVHAPVFLKYRWEMDRPNLRGIVHSAADYIAAWDHVRQIFASVGTPNVSWVWCPTAGGFANGTAPAYYPGDNEVDWVCTDAYPPAAPGPVRYESFPHLARPFLNWTKQNDKPVMIGEYGVPRSYSPSQRAEWFDQVRALVTGSRRIKALVYFDHDPIGAPIESSYALGDDRTVIGAFRRLVNDPYLQIPNS